MYSGVEATGEFALLSFFLSFFSIFSLYWMFAKSLQSLSERPGKHAFTQVQPC